VPGGHIQVQFSDAAGMTAAARALGQAAPDADALTLQVPYDGSVGSLKNLLDRLDGQAIPAGGLSVHTPDLDDVFFPLTRPPRPAPARTGQPAMSPPSLAARDSAPMLRRDVLHALRFPMMTISGMLLPVLLLLLFAGVFGHALAASLGAAPGGTTYIDYLA